MKLKADNEIVKEIEWEGGNVWKYSPKFFKSSLSSIFLFIQMPQKHQKINYPATSHPQKPVQQKLQSKTPHSTKSNDMQTNPSLIQTFPQLKINKLVK